MSEAKFEPVTETELAQLRELHDAWHVARGWSAEVKAFAAYQAHAVDLAPRMAAHLAEFTVAGQSVCENFRGGTFVDGGECVGWLAVLCGCERICYDCDEPAVDDQACAAHGGETPDGMTLVSVAELARLRAVEFEHKQAQRDERRMSGHS